MTVGTLTIIEIHRESNSLCVSIGSDVQPEAQYFREKKLGIFTRKCHTCAGGMRHGWQTPHRKFGEIHGSGWDSTGQLVNKKRLWKIATFIMETAQEYKRRLCLLLFSWRGYFTMVPVIQKYCLFSCLSTRLHRLQCIPPQIRMQCATQRDQSAGWKLVNDDTWYGCMTSVSFPSVIFLGFLHAEDCATLLDYFTCLKLTNNTVTKYSIPFVSRTLLNSKHLRIITDQK